MPCIRELRVPIATGGGMIADGTTVVKIVADFPYLYVADISEPLRYAAEAALERELPLRLVGMRILVDASMPPWLYECCSGRTRTDPRRRVPVVGCAECGDSRVAGGWTLGPAPPGTTHSPKLHRPRSFGGGAAGDTGVEGRVLPLEISTFWRCSMHATRRRARRTRSRGTRHPERGPPRGGHRIRRWPAGWRGRHPRTPGGRCRRCW